MIVVPQLAYSGALVASGEELPPVAAVRELGREVRVPGFRPGKAPAEVIVQRVGRDAVVREMLKGALGGWYSEAVSEAGVACGWSSRPPAQPPSAATRASIGPGASLDRAGRGAAARTGLTRARRRPRIASSPCAMPLGHPCAAVPSLSSGVARGPSSVSRRGARRWIPAPGF